MLLMAQAGARSARKRPGALCQGRFSWPRMSDARRNAAPPWFVFSCRLKSFFTGNETHQGVWRIFCIRKKQFYTATIKQHPVGSARNRATAQYFDLDQIRPHSSLDGGQRASPKPAQRHHIAMSRPLIYIGRSGRFMAQPDRKRTPSHARR